MTEPIYDQLTAEHARYHDQHGTATPKEHTVSLFSAVKTDLEAAGVKVEGVLHDILSKHLTLDNIAVHVANDLSGLASSPLFHVAAASAGLPANVTADLADFAAKAAGWLEHEAQPAA